MQPSPIAKENIAEQIALKLQQLEVGNVPLDDGRVLAAGQTDEQATHWRKSILELGALKQQDGNPQAEGFGACSQCQQAFLA